MHSNSAFPGLPEAVTHNLQFWRNPDLPAIVPASSFVHSLMQAQYRKGWDDFCFGIVDFSWAKDFFFESM